MSRNVFEHYFRKSSLYNVLNISLSKYSSIIQPPPGNIITLHSVVVLLQCITNCQPNIMKLFKHYEFIFIYTIQMYVFVHIYICICVFFFSFLRQFIDGYWICITFTSLSAPIPPMVPYVWPWDIWYCTSLFLLKHWRDKC